MFRKLLTVIILTSPSLTGAGQVSVVNPSGITSITVSTTNSIPNTPNLATAPIVPSSSSPSSSLQPETGNASVEPLMGTSSQGAGANIADTNASAPNGISDGSSPVSLQAIAPTNAQGSGNNKLDGGKSSLSSPRNLSAALNEIRVEQFTISEINSLVTLIEKKLIRVNSGSPAYAILQRELARIREIK